MADQEIIDAIRIGMRDAVAEIRASSGSGGSGGNSRPSTPSSSRPSQASLEEFDNAVTAGAADLFTNAGRSSASVISKALGNLPLVGGSVELFSGAIGEAHAVFQQLSKVGAGFNGDLGELRLGAAQANMTLPEFAALIQANTTQLAGFSGGVQGGVRQFRLLSQAMTTGPNPLLTQFNNLGMTLEESNDFILANMEFQRRDARFRRADGSLNHDLMVQNSLQMAKSLDIMAKVAGKELKQMQDDLVDRQRNGATQARLRLLEQQGVEGASDAYMQAQASLQGAPKVAQDLLDDLVQTGAPMTDATRAFAATNKEAYAALVQQANAIRSGDAARASMLGERATAAAAAYANSEQGLTLATLSQLSPVAQGQAEVLEQMGPLIDQIQERASGIGTSLNTTQGYVDTFNQIMADQIANQAAQTSGQGPGQGIQTTIDEFDRNSRELSEQMNTQFSRQLSNNEQLAGLIETTARETANAMRGAMSIFQGIINELPGAEAASAEGMSVDEKIAAASQINPLVGRQLEILQDETADRATRTRALEALEGIITTDGLRITDVDVSAVPRPGRATGGAVTAGSPYQIGELGPETFVPNMDGAIIPNMKAVMNRMPDIVNNVQDQLASTAQQMTRSMGEMQNAGSLEQKLDILNQTMLQLVSINNMQARTGEKQLKMSRGVGNLMSGIGRA